MPTPIKPYSISLQPIAKTLTCRPTLPPPPYTNRKHSLMPIINHKQSHKPFTSFAKHILEPIKHTAIASRNRGSSLKIGNKAEVGLFDNRILVSHSRPRHQVQHVKLSRQQGLTPRQHFQRRESSLNTFFNRRKKVLKQITKDNKLIYQRINSQKSLYSSRQLNRSFDSNCSLSRKLSNSRLSKASSQRSLGSSRQSKKKQSQANRIKKSIKIQSQNINRVQKGQIGRYLNIFCNNIASTSSQKNSITSAKPVSLPKPIDKQNEKTRMVKINNLEKIIEEFTGPQRRNNQALRRIL